MSLLHRLTYRLSRKLETFDASEYFVGKTVVLIGPNCGPPGELAPRVKRADILVVVNKGHRSKSFVELRPLAREVVLFHCLHLSEEVGGGKFGGLELRRKGFHAVFFPLYGDIFENEIVAFHRTNFTQLRLRRIGRESYEALTSQTPGFYPNTGYAAIWTIAKGNCASLYISGMDFMRKPYQSGYHNHFADHQAAIALIEKVGCHNPDLDLESFRELRKTHNIQVDVTLDEILSKPTERLFYQQRLPGTSG